MGRKLQIFQLDTDSVAAAAGYQTQRESLRKIAQNSARAGKKLGSFSGVGLAPDAVGFVPARAIETRRPVNAIPIGMIVASEILRSEFDAKRLEHRKICALVRRKRIKQCAIPIEEHSFRGKNRSLHAMMLTEKPCRNSARIPSISRDFVQAINAASASSALCRNGA